MDTLNHFLTLIALGGTAAAAAMFFSRHTASRVRPEVPVQPGPALAAISAWVTIALAGSVSSGWAQLAVAVSVPLFVVAASIDSQTRRIPNSFTLYGAAVCVAAAACASATGSGAVVGAAAVTGAVTFAVFLALNIASHDGFGMGDVKLGAVMTFLLTLLTAPSWSGSGLPVLDELMLATVTTGWAFLAFLTGGVWITVRAARGQKDGVPFGPFMVGAWFVALAAVHAATGFIQHLA